jgi:hypothetical protein
LPRYRECGGSQYKWELLLNKEGSHGEGGGSTPSSNFETGAEWLKNYFAIIIKGVKNFDLK